MPTYRIAGVSVQFPYNAYDCQLIYMERVIHALQRGANALLESPTGTGKTLCLLCATLAWRQSMKPEVRRQVSSSESDPTPSQDAGKPKLPTILYASRTHSQLQQVIGELRATTYRPKMVVLGSREQMCVHTDVQSMRGRVQNHTCRSLVKDRNCGHHNKVADYMKAHPELGDEPVDIEDLVKIGKTQGPCPYYLSRELHNTADILFLPYNYLIDKENRRSLTGINWEKTVLIFDEAHNLEGLCADAASFDLPSSHLAACIGEAKQCVELAIQNRHVNNGADTSVDPETFAMLKALLLELEKRINEVPMDSAELGFTRPGSYMYEFLETLKINWETAPTLIDTIEQATSLLEDEVATGPGMQKRSPHTAYRLLSLRDALKLIFRGADTNHSSYYKMHIQQAQNPERGKNARQGAGRCNRTLSWWCFNPGIAMEEFSKMGVRSVILTSGTLAPLESFACELNLPFDIRLENPHVIDSSQIWVGVVSSGPSGRPLNSSYKSRDSPEYKQELGNTIVNFARIVPDGLLVFFPSYHLLNSCIDAWQSPAPGFPSNSSTIWERISKFKQPVVEPKESALFNQANQRFTEMVSDPSSSGAVFLAVCRGKVSEGLDFADKAGRAVVVTGIPYAMKNDPKVRLKREYLDEAFRANSTRKKVIRGEAWYVQQAARAVNQAVGRVIRHRNDYGAIILCDERFAHGNSQNQMSLWLRPRIKCYPKFGDASLTLTRFFRDRAGADLPYLQKSLAVVNPQTKEKSGGEASRDNALSLYHKDSSTTLRMVQAQGNAAHIIGLSETSKVTAQPLSTMLAARRAEANNLTAASIIQANCSVGSTVGFQVNESRYGGSKIQVAAGLKSSSQDIRTNLEVTASSTESSITLQLSHGSEVDVHSLGKRPPEAFQKPWSLGEHITRESKASKSAEPPTVLEGVDHKDLNGSKEETIQSAESASRGQGEGNGPASKHSMRDGKKKGSVSAGEQVQKEPQIGSQNGEPKVPGRASTQKAKNAAGFLQEVKAHLSILEYKRFLEYMRALKNQVICINSLLNSVSNLFFAPERMFLFERFGDFIPSQHRKLYEECLADRRADLHFDATGERLGPQKGQK